MKPLFPLCIAMCFLVAGCGHHTYELDLAQVPDGDWKGRVRLIQSRETRPGLLLIPENIWNIERLQLISPEGQTIDIRTFSDGRMPEARAGLHELRGFWLLNGSDLWGERAAVLVVDPDTLSQASSAATTQPNTSVPVPKASIRQVPNGLRPYLQHAEEIPLADWLAIALRESELATVRFEIPGEGLVVTISGDPRKFGPATTEVRTHSGELVRRFELKQLPVREIEADHGRHGE